MTALEDAVLLLLGYERERFEAVMLKSKPHRMPNPFKERIAMLQAEIKERQTEPRSTSTAPTSESTNGGGG